MVIYIFKNLKLVHFILTWLLPSGTTWGSVMSDSFFSWFKISLKCYFYNLLLFSWLLRFSVSAPFEGRLFKRWNFTLWLSFKSKRLSSSNLLSSIFISLTLSFWAFGVPLILLWTELNSLLKLIPDEFPIRDISLFLFRL